MKAKIEHIVSGYTHKGEITLQPGDTILATEDRGTAYLYIERNGASLLNEKGYTLAIEKLTLVE